MTRKKQTGSVKSISFMALWLAMLTSGTGLAVASPGDGPQAGMGQFPVIAGGSLSAGNLGTECVGWIASGGPTHTFTREKAVHVMVIQATSDDDNVLVVEAPDGEIHCDDDSLGDGNATLTFYDEEALLADIWASDDDAQHFIDGGSGTYNIWVGTYSRDYGTARATLAIFEAPAEFPDSRMPDIRLQGEFAREQVDVIAGGNYSLSMLAPEDCMGFVTGESSYALHYEAGPGANDLHFDVYSGSVDTTLAVRTPVGEWRCNDDHLDSYPSIFVGNPDNGTYHVWVGTLDLGDVGERAKLFFRSVAGIAQGARGAAVPHEPSMESSGSGFLVSEVGHVLSNHHVVHGCSELSVQRPGHFEAPAELIAWNEAADLALLRIESDDEFPHVSFRSNLPARTGEEVATFGYPGNFQHGPTFTTGVITSLSGFKGHLQELQFNAEVRAGSSGSPIFDRSGNVIGIATGVLSSGSKDDKPINVNYGTRGFIVQVFLEVNNVPFIQESSDSDLSWVEIAEDVQSVVLEVGCYH
ncbi:MAG: serine protease [Rhodobacteraceae bacterium]|nr:serine protease [Paracoccaceae bacterium]MCY4141361.1 serine protease [Paracoccaceae bacterium]